MNIDFTDQPTTGVSPAPTTFGLLVPGSLVHTQFLPVDNLKFSLQLSCPGDISSPITAINEIVFFLLPNVTLPHDTGVLVYWQIASTANTMMSEPQSTGFELLGSLTPDRPSGVFQTGWSEHPQLMDLSPDTPVSVNFGVSLEPLATVANLAATRDSAYQQRRLFVAQKIASDLFNFMQSFDKGTGGAGNMVVPTSIFDRWFLRFSNRFKRDPNFFMKSSE
jgi:hypothetical protein